MSSDPIPPRSGLVRSTSKSALRAGQRKAHYVKDHVAGDDVVAICGATIHGVQWLDSRERMPDTRPCSKCRELVQAGQVAPPDGP